MVKVAEPTDSARSEQASHAETVPAAQQAAKDSASVAKAIRPTDDALVLSEPVKSVIKTKDGKLILGQQEWVWLSPAKQFVRAHVVQTQSTSTLGVTSVLPFERDGRPWVKFKVRGKVFELPVSRWQESKEKKRAVVQVRTVLGDMSEMTDFVLVDGEDVRLGTDFIRDVAILDASRQYVQPKSKTN
ncbi:ATP-dependent zinc protease [Photobacterium galatheae]|uniref:putative ATP-dependent zinc protease n=1 Tax=Photobacterium galatheae TaxID=1654360 RepID=UPI00202CD155|nr:RimK/LysX family protein [Photobacterium galatheae]MCM0148863.1 ATP-dependent zinc protease [Photobacterium galatheae]